MTDRNVQHALFTIERSYDAAPDAVYAAFADRAIYDRWFVQADGWPVAEYSHDFRVGGHEHGRFSEDGETVYVNETVILDIVPGERIVSAYSMGIEGGEPFSASVATVEIRAEGSGTRLVYAEQGAFFDGRDTVEQREAGCRELLEALGRELARVEA